jgi:hypothetical protein
MNPVHLPARLVYTAVAVPLLGAAAFYTCMGLLPQFTAGNPQLDPSGSGYGIFRIAVCVGLAIGLTGGLMTLTLPWVRHRRIEGRGIRIAISAGLVVVSGVGFAAEGYTLLSDLGFAAWLTCVLAYTYVRYGVADTKRRTRSSREATE